MQNIKTAGLFSSLVDGIKSFWKKYNNYFDNKQQYRNILQTFQNEGFNFNPDKMNIVQKNGLTCLKNGNDTFIIFEGKLENFIKENTQILNKIIINVASKFIPKEKINLDKLNLDKQFQNYIKSLDVYNIVNSDKIMIKLEK